MKLEEFFGLCVVGAAVVGILATPVLIISVIFRLLTGW
jgi:hypothetical protein